MKIKNPMLIVTDIDKSVEFYKKVLGLRVIMDFGVNKTLTGGLALQSLESWQEFIETDDVAVSGFQRTVLRSKTDAMRSERTDL